jgi:hypothetical protein
VSLEKFLGLFTGASPESLPEGGSPLCFNCDFEVSGVLPRPGLQSQYTLAVGAYAGNGFDGGGALPWTAPFNVTGPPNGIYATRLLNHGQQSDALQTTNYGLAVLPSTVIQSITINVTGGISGFGSLPSKFPGGGGVALIISASLIYQGSVIANVFPNIFAFPDGTTDSVFSFSITNQAAGGIFTPAIVNDPSFGVSFTVNYSSTIGIARTVRLSGAQILLNISAIPGLNFNYLKTFEQTDGDVITLALDSSGTIWQEDVTNNPGILTPIVQNNEVPQTIQNYAQLGDDSGTGSFPIMGQVWANPQNIVGPPDQNYAIRTLGNFGDQSTNFLQAFDFALNVPLGATILGITVVVTGHFTFFTQGAGTPRLTIGLLSGGVTLGSLEALDFNSPTDVQYVFGSPSTLWDAGLTSADINDPSFGVNIQGFIGNGNAKNLRTAGDFEIDSVQVAVTYLNVTSLQQIQPNTFAESVTVDDREFIAFSNLLNGTDIPRTFDGVNFPRLSQVGPGAPPTASTTTTGSAISSITQNPAFPLPVNAHSFLLVSDSPSDIGSFGAPATPGNVMTIVLPSGTVLPSYLLPGSNIVLAGFPTINGFRVNNDPAGLLAPAFYTVTSVGLPIPGQQSYDALTFTVNFTTFYNKPTSGGATFQATEATLTTPVQVPNLEVGDQFQIAATGGAPPSGYDGTWRVDQTPNASQLQIVSTVLVNNTATYGFNLISGTAPVAGEAVTVANTLNGNGIFNVVNAIISSVTAGTFSLQLNSPSNIGSAAEDGSGIIFGTIFQFDPFGIVGNKLGVGTIVTIGVIAAGIRKICYSFLTDNGYVTQPSPIFTFDVVAGAQTLAVGNLLPGPSNVIARIVHLTAAQGGNFYNIPVPVTVISNGQNVVNTSTYLLDNTSTSITLSFSDDVLTAATEIDVPGNNLFETTELGAPVALIPYAARIFALGEQNKVQNFRNHSFDGGIQVNRGNSATGGAGVVQTYPAGWTPQGLSLTASVLYGGSVVNSPIFGWAYQITANGGSSTTGNVGMITQPASQDEFEVPIINASTTYSVRLTASAVPSAPGSLGNLVVDLFSPGLNRVFGAFTLQLAEMTQQMAIYTGTLLTKGLAPVPPDLLLRVYLTGVADTWTVTIDRIEPFPTEQPNLSGQIIGSYQGNFEAFDRVNGVILTDVQNQQLNVSAFTLFDTLYVVKTNSLISTLDNKTTEPSQWTTPRTISNDVGTTSVYGVAGVNNQDSGESWAIIAGQPGAFVFNGGEPVKITEEIQELWNLINWRYGHTLWVTNDITNRRFLIGVPMKTFTVQNGVNVQNPWIPLGLIPDNGNPTTPNIIIALNYKFLTTGAEVGGRAEIHVSSFGGKLLSVDMARKWNIWSIQSPCAGLIKRQDKTQQTFFGNSEGTAKVYQLTPGLLEDDGEAFWQLWTSHGWPTPEQEQQFQLGSVRKVFEYMVMVLEGSGDVTITVYPDSMKSPYAHALLPDLILPATSGGDVEMPVNEAGNRLFLQFSCNSVGAGFTLSRVMLAMRSDPWSPVRGMNT